MYDISTCITYVYTYYMCMYHIYILYVFVLHIHITMTYLLHFGRLGSASFVVSWTYVNLLCPILCRVIPAAQRIQLLPIVSQFFNQFLFTKSVFTPTRPPFLIYAFFPRKGELWYSKSSCNSLRKTLTISGSFVDQHISYKHKTKWDPKRKRIGCYSMTHCFNDFLKIYFINCFLLQAQKSVICFFKGLRTRE